MSLLQWQKRLVLIAAAVFLLLGLVNGVVSAPAPPVRIAYVNWSSSVASGNLVCAVVREVLGRRCELIETTADGMWRAVADGEADALLSAWLPDTHAHFLAEYGDRLEDLGANLDGTRTGLVMPDVGVGRQTGGYGARTPPAVRVGSIADLAEQSDAVGGRIIGIDPEAGIMAATERALEVYRLDGLRLVSGSEAEMTAALARAIARNQPIVVTGWEPHWMFGRWSLRFLDDPENVYGGRGSIHTMARKGLAQDEPELHRLLDRFHWDADAMNLLMVWIEQGAGEDPYRSALRWMQTHRQQVDEWTR